MLVVSSLKTGKEYFEITQRGKSGQQKNRVAGESQSFSRKLLERDRAAETKQGETLWVVIPEGFL